MQASSHTHTIILLAETLQLFARGRFVTAPFPHVGDNMDIHLMNENLASNCIISKDEIVKCVLVFTRDRQ